ncbi:hypothetical protein QVD17_16102 [Tagetes erecta]|uniref:Uncharacterized protein n=1 Tax=Tagetes erecta TaxID=13708 RepID=A0AAD8KQV4_TARER|nr:hypothetical protein QVD17_16102 [Tagetes erecta]
MMMMVGFEDVENVRTLHLLNGDGVLAIHAGERLVRGIITDAITTPMVITFAYVFKKTIELIDFKHHVSFEDGCYRNPTTEVLENKIRHCYDGGHIVTTTDCYRKSRIFIEMFPPMMGITI